MYTTKQQKIRYCKYMKEIFDDCSERQLRKIKRIAHRMERVISRALVVTSKVNRFIPNVKVSATWGHYGPTPRPWLKYKKTAEPGRKGPKEWFVYSPFDTMTLKFYEENLRRKDITTVDLSGFLND